MRRHERGVTGVAFTPDGSRLASSSIDGTVVIWNPATGLPGVVLDAGRFVGNGAGRQSRRRVACRGKPGRQGPNLGCARGHLASARLRNRQPAAHARGVGHACRRRGALPGGMPALSSTCGTSRIVTGPGRDQTPFSSHAVNRLRVHSSGCVRRLPSPSMNPNPVTRTALPDLPVVTTQARPGTWVTI